MPQTQKYFGLDECLMGFWLDFFMSLFSYLDIFLGYDELHLPETPTITQPPLTMESGCDASWEMQSNREPSLQNKMGAWAMGPSTPRGHFQTIVFQVSLLNFFCGKCGWKPCYFFVELHEREPIFQSVLLYADAGVRLPRCHCKIQELICKFFGMHTCPRPFKTKSGTYLNTLVGLSCPYCWEHYKA